MKGTTPTQPTRRCVAALGHGLLDPQEARHCGKRKDDEHLMDRPKSVALMGLFSSEVRNRKLSGLTSL